MSSTERDEYLKRRAAQERVAAKLAGDARAARSHSEMARRYGAMADDETDAVDPQADERLPVLSPEFRIFP